MFHVMCLKCSKFKNIFEYYTCFLEIYLHILYKKREIYIPIKDNNECIDEILPF